jgi:hypothetical protein
MPTIPSINYFATKELQRTQRRQMRDAMKNAIANGIGANGNGADGKLPAPYNLPAPYDEALQKDAALLSEGLAILGLVKYYLRSQNDGAEGAPSKNSFDDNAYGAEGALPEKAYDGNGDGALTDTLILADPPYTNWREVFPLEKQRRIFLLWHHWNINKGILQGILPPAAYSSMAQDILYLEKFLPMYLMRGLRKPATAQTPEDLL